MELLTTSRKLLILASLESIRNQVNTTEIVVEAPAPAPAPNGTVTWQFVEGDSIPSIANTEIILATGVPEGAIYYASPDLLPGQTLKLVDSKLILVNSSTVPNNIDGTVPNSVFDNISDRNINIEVMDSPLCRARNLRFPLDWWGAGESTEDIYGLPGGRARAAYVLSTVYGPNRCRPGDIIEVSPGAFNVGWGAYREDSTFLNIECSVTIRNIPGRGRWMLREPKTYTSAELGYNANGIVLNRPIACYNQERVEVVIEGGEITNFGTGGSAIRMRKDSGGFAGQPRSLTVRNCKLGQYKPHRSASAISGGAEFITIEDSHLMDAGDGLGNEHNAYISAREMVLRGCRVSRSYGYSVFPPPDNYWSSYAKMDGHLLKLSAIKGTIEGCSIDATGSADASLVMQLKAGGNWIIRGNLIIGNHFPNNGNGMISMLREYGGVTGEYPYATGATTDGGDYPLGATSIGLAAAGSGPLNQLDQIYIDEDPYPYQVRSSTISNVASGGGFTIWPGLRMPISGGAKSVRVWTRPNMESWAGSEGNSLLFERNVVISHYPRSLLWFRPQIDTTGRLGAYEALRPAIGGDWLPQERLNSLIVRDNIGMCAPGPAPWSLADFPGADNALWIRNAPDDGGTWNARGNITVPYSTSEEAFSQKELLQYNLASGAIESSTGEVSTRRFTWPHGSITRTDSQRGLG